MAGKRPGVLKPALIVTCGDNITRKRVEKIFKGQDWLQELLKANGITFIALVAKTSLSSGPTAASAALLSIENAYMIQRLSAQAETSCGQGILVRTSSRDQQVCTLGGLILVNGKIMGMTAGHPFETHETDHTSTQPELFDSFQCGEDLEDDESSENSGEPFVFNDDEEGSDSGTSGSSVSLQNDTGAEFCRDHSPIPSLVERPSMPLFLTEWYMPRTANVILPTPPLLSSTEEAQFSFDWALLDPFPANQSTKLNKVAYVDPVHNVLVKNMISGSAQGDVTVLLGTVGPQMGNLQPCPVTLQINRRVYNVQLITLERILRKLSRF